MASARHLSVLKVGLSLACLGMVALWPEWRVSLQAQGYCRSTCEPLPPECEAENLSCGFEVRGNNACAVCVEQEEVEIKEECPLSCFPGKEICALVNGNYECIEPNDSDDELGGSNDDRNVITGQPGLKSGDPINNTTGTLLQIETDYVGAGAFPLVLRRTYNSPPPSAEALPGPFGANWSHSYSANIRVVSPTSVQIVSADSKTLTFDQQGDGSWRSSPDVHSGLWLVIDGEGNHSGWQYRTGSDNFETYDTAGRLLSIATRAGLTQSLNYDVEGHLESVADPFGRTLTFAYDGQRISSVTDPAGGIYSYTYDSKGNLASVTGPDEPERKNSSLPLRGQFLPQCSHRCDR